MTDMLHIRTARPADLGAILTLLADDDLGRTRDDPDGAADPAYFAAFAAIAADPNQQLLVAERDGAVVGTFQLSFIPGLSHHGSWRAQIEAVRVARTLRGQGLGRQMILWAIDAARARGCTLVQLTSSNSRTAAHRFYAGLGFTQSHAGFKRAL
ncbi:N-acetyltransferase family protein [Tropicibacter sp. S64]|uniref:GNAT family N-acetyltransferase n=1 Tax=Tropicibacter sp. S64 TaxID=3415122 RepID=UPI003C7BE480